MTPESIVLILGALGTLLTILGAGGKWLLGHIDKKTLESELRENAARQELQNRMQSEIDGLRVEIKAMRDERATERALFVRRIYDLEYLIHTLPGINLPKTDGWPPT